MTAGPPSLVNILLVDDKPENLFALEELLRRPDRQLFKASSGNDALRLLLKHEFALVLLDVEMPGMDGYEVAQLMRTAQRTRLVPLIFVTAGDRADERTFRGYDAGAVDFLYKPINAHTLTSKVDVFVDLHRKTRDLELANATLERTSTALRDKIADLENVSHTLSHDLRAPLRTIRSFARVLQEDGAGAVSASAGDALDRIVRAADRMGNLIDDLYALLRLSAIEAASADVDLGAALAEVVETLRGDIDAGGATVTHDALPKVWAHRTLLAQILQNLISNSLKFRGEAPPAVHVRAERLADAWQISVDDNGIGIAPEDRERVFGLFERATTKTAGTGVGLALCKRAIEKLGGKIWIAGRPQGGTTVAFTLPHAPTRRGTP